MVGTRGRTSILKATAGEVGGAVEGVSVSGGGGHVPDRELHHRADPRYGQGSLVSRSIRDRSASLGDVPQTLE